MLTAEQMEVQDQCIRVCQLKLGDAKCDGVYIDLSCVGDDWWFYSDDMSYPVTKDETKEVPYPILVI